MQSGIEHKDYADYVVQCQLRNLRPIPQSQFNQPDFRYLEYTRYCESIGAQPGSFRTYEETVNSITI